MELKEAIRTVLEKTKAQKLKIVSPSEPLSRLFSELSGVNTSISRHGDMVEITVYAKEQKEEEVSDIEDVAPYYSNDDRPPTTPMCPLTRKPCLTRCAWYDCKRKECIIVTATRTLDYLLYAVERR